MGLFRHDIKTMEDLFVHMLQDMLYAEHRIIKAMPALIDQAADPALKQSLDAHLGETETHVGRLTQVFQILGRRVTSVDCPAIDGIIRETEEVTGEINDRAVMDAAIIAATQAVEHYEITRYGSLIAWAKQLGHDDCARILELTLREEKAADQRLTSLAAQSINRRAELEST